VTRFLVLYAGMTVLAAILASVTGCPSLFRLPPDATLLGLSTAAAVGFALGIYWLGIVLESRAWYRDMAAFLKKVITSSELLGKDLDGQRALVVAIYSSVGEEALFRGFLQPYFIAILAGAMDAPDSLAATALGIVAASLVFGLLHFPMVEELRPWTLFAVLAGAAFGVLAAWSGSLVAPILAHLVINWLNLRRLANLPFEPSRPIGPPDAPAP
jgi:CAAX protease family protein